MRELREIANEIEANWKVIRNAGARNALQCMKKMGVITSPFGADPDGYAIVGTFLTYAIGWRGEVARRIKLELRKMYGHARPTSRKPYARG